MFYQLDLFAPQPIMEKPLDMPGVVEKIMAVSPRPRYTLLVLNMLAKAANPKGVAGPYIIDEGRAVPVRDWLGRALIPMAQRHHRRQDIRRKLLDEMKKKAMVPASQAELDKLLDAQVQERLQQSARCGVSRAVSDLVRAGLVHRHYQGYHVDHHNRGAQREVVYTLFPEVKAALS
ncbi:hypothetical protein [Novosphingobium sp. YAF33]|uniref:hypothetical protein n=1 Tax=Novosphingobium sp. YAF33 TaxID=3233082 RepID=UPI003F9B480E